MRARVILLLGLLGVSAAGCSFHSNARAERARLVEGEFAAATVPESAWPARDMESLQELVSLTPEVLTMRVPRSIITDGRIEEDTVSAAMMRVVHTEACGRGIIREFAPIIETTPESERSWDWLSSGLQFVSYRPVAGPPADVDPASDQVQRWKRRVLYRRLGFRPGSSETWTLATQGTRMHFVEGAAGVPHRGLVVHMSSLGGFAYEEGVIERLVERGWSVLRVNASMLHREERPVRIRGEGDVEDAGAQVAQIVDNRLAEMAYAVEAGLAYLGKTRPRQSGGPVVIIGYSAGALAAPAVAALIKERVEAVVLIGGGANLLDISQRSTLTNGGLEVKWPGDKPPEGLRERLYDSYLSHVALDPYKTAACLDDVPVLMLHALWDDIVPAHDGELLYERLGRPERVCFTMGHRGLFFRLSAEAAWLAQWVDRTVRTADRGAGAPAEAPHHAVP